MDATADGPISFEDATNVILEVFAGEDEAFWDMMYITTGSGEQAYTERVDSHSDFLEKYPNDAAEFAAQEICVV